MFGSTNSGLVPRCVCVCVCGGGGGGGGGKGVSVASQLSIKPSEEDSNHATS